MDERDVVKMRERRTTVLTVELGWWRMLPRDSGTWEVKAGRLEV